MDKVQEIQLELLKEFAKVASSRKIWESTIILFLLTVGSMSVIIHDFCF